MFLSDDSLDAVPVPNETSNNVASTPDSHVLQQLRMRLKKTHSESPICSSDTNSGSGSAGIQFVYI